MSQTMTPGYVSCPGCNQSLPEGRTVCQFCGHQIAAAPKARGGVTQGRSESQPIPWTLWAYYACSAFIALSGLYQILQGLGVGKSLLSGSYIGVVVGGIQLVIGAGLLARMSWAQNIMIWLGWINIILILLSVPILVGLFMGSPLLFLGMLALTIFQLAYNGLLLWLISEHSDVF